MERPCGRSPWRAKRGKPKEADVGKQTKWEKAFLSGALAALAGVDTHGGGTVDRDIVAAMGGVKALWPAGSEFDREHLERNGFTAGRMDNPLKGGWAEMPPLGGRPNRGLSPSAAKITSNSGRGRTAHDINVSPLSSGGAHPRLTKGRPTLPQALAPSHSHLIIPPLPSGQRPPQPRGHLLLDSALGAGDFYHGPPHLRASGRSALSTASPAPRSGGAYLLFESKKVTSTLKTHIGLHLKPMGKPKK